jgi:hypothetical protein
MHAVSCEPTKGESTKQANDGWVHEQAEPDAEGPQHPDHIVVQYSWASRNHALYADYLAWQRATSTKPNETPYSQEVKSRNRLEWIEAGLQKADVTDNPPGRRRRP